MEGIRLLPCPLCDGNARFEDTSSIRGPWSSWGMSALGYTVICCSCGCTIPSCMSKERAAEVWNRRADDR